jgi:hypothetical protein
MFRRALFEGEVRRAQSGDVRECHDPRREAVELTDLVVIGRFIPMTGTTAGKWR